MTRSTPASARTLVPALTLLTALASPAAAHPGHAAAGRGWLEHLLSPEHLAALALAAVLAAAGVLALRRARRPHDR